MKALSIYIALLVFAAAGMFWVLNNVESPEHLIIGSWKEHSWEYEKAYSTATLKVMNRDTISQSVKDQLGRHLMIHSAETWDFHPDGSLELHGADTVKRVKWRLKGRGHILELEYADRVIEHYNLTELDRNTMVLNFDSDIQVKGIAKLTFNK